MTKNKSCPPAIENVKLFEAIEIKIPLYNLYIHRAYIKVSTCHNLNRGSEKIDHFSQIYGRVGKKYFSFVWESSRVKFS